MKYIINIGLEGNIYGDVITQLNNLRGLFMEAKEIKYIVWVDSIPNYFNNLLDAEIEQMEWIEKGYDNITIEITNK
jgi:hypothetical protein